MIKLLSGPLAETVFPRWDRRPLFVRIVVDRGGNVEALTDPAQAPLDEHAVYLYHLLEKHGERTAVETVTGPDGVERTRGKIEVGATYEYAEPQPAAAILRDNERFRAWALNQPKLTADGRPITEPEEDA